MQCENSLRKSIAKILIRMHIDFNRDQPTEKMLSAMAFSWAKHLRNVGVGEKQIEEIYDNVVQSKGRDRDSYLPTVSDFVAAWREMVDAGYWDRQHESVHEEYAALPSPPPNTKSLGFRVFKMSEKRTRAGLDTVCCDCTCDYGYGIPAKLTDDGKYFCCRNGVCDFREPIEKLMEIRCHPTYEPAGNLRNVKTSRSNPVILGDVEVLKELNKRCNVDFSSLDLSVVGDFGRYLLEIGLPMSTWNYEIVKQLWKGWQESINKRKGVSVAS